MEDIYVDTKAVLVSLTELSFHIRYMDVDLAHCYLASILQISHQDAKRMNRIYKNYFTLEGLQLFE
jgi:hypothetical protein